MRAPPPSGRPTTPAARSCPTAYSPRGQAVLHPRRRAARSRASLDAESGTAAGAADDVPCRCDTVDERERPLARRRESRSLSSRGGHLGAARPRASGSGVARHPPQDGAVRVTFEHVIVTGSRSARARARGGSAPRPPGPAAPRGAAAPGPIARYAAFLVARVAGDLEQVGARAQRVHRGRGDRCPRHRRHRVRSLVIATPSKPSSAQQL